MSIFKEILSMLVGYIPISNTGSTAHVVGEIKFYCSNPRCVYYEEEIKVDFSTPITCTSCNREVCARCKMCNTYIPITQYNHHIHTKTSIPVIYERYGYD